MIGTWREMLLYVHTVLDISRNYRPTQLFSEPRQYSAEEIESRLENYVFVTDQGERFVRDVYLQYENCKFPLIFENELRLASLLVSAYSKSLLQHRLSVRAPPPPLPHALQSMRSCFEKTV